MTSPQNHTHKSLILPFQKPIFDRLHAVARACMFVDRSQFTVLKLRSCFWLIGPTGSGKTFLARALAHEIGVPLLPIAVSDWIILGGNNRGSTTTWPNILSFLNKNKDKRGAIIFVDELDKCREDSNWNSFLRSEIFSLCDGRVPLGINDLDDHDHDTNPVEIAESFLRNKVMIIGGAAFQELWDSKPSFGLGFNPPKPSSSLPELPDLTRMLPRELINRFCSEMFILPQLQEKDYCDMLEAMSAHVPPTWRERFVDVGLSLVDQAHRHHKGARFLEEALLAAVVHERLALSSFVPDTHEISEPSETKDGFKIEI